MCVTLLGAALPGHKPYLPPPTAPKGRVVLPIPSDWTGNQGHGPVSSSEALLVAWSLQKARLITTAGVERGGQWAEEALGVRSWAGAPALKCPHGAHALHNCTHEA